MAFDDIGKRMKEFYEHPYRFFFPRKSNVVVRIDGRAFHSYTRGMEKPFDTRLIEAMQRTMLYVCENIQGAMLGYTQSDEITVVMHDKQDLRSDGWFGYNKSKIETGAVSLATAKFNRLMIDRQPAHFDARAFVIPTDYEVFNNLLWRQLDCVRNSISMLAQANFSHKQLHEKNTKQMQELLFQEKGINWSELPQHLKNGTVCYRVNGVWTLEAAFDFHDADRLRDIIFPQPVCGDKI